MNRKTLLILVFVAAVVGEAGCSTRRPVPAPDDMTFAEAGKDGGVKADLMPLDLMPPDASGPAASPWAVSAGGTSTDWGHSIAVDGWGNSYITGYFRRTATFGSTTMTAKGLSSLFVAKLDSSGKFTWTVAAGGNGWIYGRSIAVDGSGNAYITGHFEGTATFGNTTLTAKGKQDIFVAKLDSTGTFAWTVAAGGTSYDYGRSIAVDDWGNTYITGDFRGAATFDSTTLAAKGGLHDRDIFVAKLDKSGKFAWATAAGGYSPDDGAAIALDGSGNTYITGHFENTAMFGSTSLTSKGKDDIFVAKLDKSGKFAWATAAGGTSPAGGTSISMDGSGNTYITGYFNGTAMFGSTTLTTKGRDDIFVAKLDKSGKFTWAVAAGGTWKDIGDSIAVDGWGNAYITGLFRITAMFGSMTLTAKGDYDIFVAKLDKSGKFTWVVAGGGTSSDIGSSIVVDGWGTPYITGHFTGTAMFGSTTLTAKGTSNLIDIFVAKLDKTGKF